MRSKLEDLKFAYLLDYEGREGSPPIGKITLPVHAFASINHKDFGGLPYPLEGEQLIEFWVVPHGETAIIGQNVLFENNFFYDLSRNMLDNNCKVTFPMMLGRVVTPSDLPRPLNEAEDLRPATFLSPVPGDPEPDHIPLPDVPEPARQQRYTKDEISKWAEAQSDWPALNAKIVDVLYNHQDLFGPLPARHETRLPVVSVDVVSAPNGPPILEGLSRSVPYTKREAAMEAHRQLEEAGFVKHCPRSELKNIFAHVYVWRKNGKIRCTLDVSTFNGRVERREVVMPGMRYFTTPMHGCSVFSDLDWKDFFWSFNYDEETSKLFGFVLPDGKTFGRYLAMVMGFHNSPGVAQALGNRLAIIPLREQFNQQTVSVQGVDMPVHGIANYVDNTSLFSRLAVRPDPDSAEAEALAEKHLYEAVVPFLEQSRKLGLRFRQDNNRLLKKTSQALGTVTDGVKVSVDPSRIAGYAELQPAQKKDIKYVYHVRGIFTYYMRFVGTEAYQRDIQMFTDMIVTHNRTKQHIPTLWKEEHDAAFYRLRDALINAVPNYVLNPAKPLYVQVDALNEGWSGQLFQYDDKGHICPIALFAYLWNKNQAGYGTKEQECFAIVETMRMIRKLRLPTEVIIRTDHENLLYLRKSPTSTLQRWYFELRSYGGVSFQHVPGVVNRLDHPSRAASATTPVGEGSYPEPTWYPPMSHGTHVAAVQTRRQRGSLRADAPVFEPKHATRQRRVQFKEPEDAAPELVQQQQQLHHQQQQPSRAASGEAARVGQVRPTRDKTDSPSFLQRVAQAQGEFLVSEEIAEMTANNKKYFKLVGGHGGRPQYWTRRGKIVIPGSATQLINEILEEGHEGHHHGGIHDLEDRTRHFYWKYKAESNYDHIHSCPACQIIRAPHHGGPAGAPHINNTHSPFQTVIVDHVPMQKSIEGYTAFVTFTDVFTRWTEAIPVANLSAPDALAALHLFRTRHSLPVTVQVDNHGAFEGEFETYCNNAGVKIKKIESYHAQANARGERPHALIRSKLSAYCSAGKHTLWAQALPFIMEACMTTFNRNIGMTPFQALYGRSHTSSFDLKVGAEFLNITIDQYQDVIHAVQKTLGVRNELASDLQYQYLVGDTPTAPKFNKGDAVALWFPTRPTKNHSYWHRGYVIMDEPRPDFYTVGQKELDGSISKTETVPVKRLRNYDNKRSPDGGVWMELKDRYRVVDAIVGHTVKDGRYRFKVKWRQHGPDLGDGENVTPFAELRSLMRNCKEQLSAYCKEHGIKYYLLERQRATEARETKEEEDNISASDAGDDD